MKKLYTEEKWKRHSKNRSNSELKRKIKLNKKTQLKINNQKKRLEVNRQLQELALKHKLFNPKKPNHLYAPENFSLINNPERMTEFFALVDSKSKEYKKVILDLSEVKKITEDAILYILLIFHREKNNANATSFHGISPKNDRCERLIIESGFFNFVQSNISEKKKTNISGNIFATKDGETVDGEITNEFVQFYLSKSNNEKYKRALYNTIIECMANTRQHAYTKNQSNIDPKWWMIAQYNKSKKVIHFTFLDCGLGIPQTVKKYVHRLEFIRLQDNALIWSALQGEQRSETGERYRGRGLQSIYKNYKTNLKVISSKGYINCEKNENKPLKNKFRGTLLSWDVYLEG